MRVAKSVHWSRSATLSGSNATWSPNSAISARNASMRSLRAARSAATTRRPPRARYLQISVPRPPIPPVTTAMRCSIVFAPGWLLRCGMERRQVLLRRGGRGRTARPVDSGLGVLVRLLLRIECAAADAAEEALLQVLPHVHVPLGQVVEHRPRRLPEHAVELAAELLLLVEEDLQAALEVATHEALQRIAVETDDLRQQLGGEHRLAAILVLRDDLQQHRAGQVLAGLGVADLELFVLQHQLADLLQSDVAGDLGVVEAAVRVLLDDARRSHRTTLAECDAAHQLVMLRSNRSCLDRRFGALGRGRPELRRDRGAGRPAAVQPTRSQRRLDARSAAGRKGGPAAKVGPQPSSLKDLPSHVLPAIDRQVRARDPARLVLGEEADRVGDL